MSIIWFDIGVFKGIDLTEAVDDEDG